MKIIYFLSLFFIFTGISVATIGVGVGTGKIQVDEQLKPGVIYEIPSLTVINTGDEPSEYEVNISYHEKQTELRPPESWFIFTPEQFHLEPGEAQLVTIKLNLPLSMEPGNYFGYLEGHPLVTTESGNTSIGVAAAAKLYFSVVPTNIWSAIYYKVITFWEVFAPWPQRVSFAIVVLVILVVFKRFFNIQINVKQTEKHHSKKTQEGYDSSKEKNE